MRGDHPEPDDLVLDRLQLTQPPRIQTWSAITDAPLASVLPSPRGEAAWLTAAPGGHQGLRYGHRRRLRRPFRRREALRRRAHPLLGQSLCAALADGGRQDAVLEGVQRRPGAGGDPDLGVDPLQMAVDGL